MNHNLMDADALVGVNLEHSADEVCSQRVDCVWDGVVSLWVKAEVRYILR